MSGVNLKAGDIPEEASGKYRVLVQWDGFRTATEKTSDYNIGSADWMVSRRLSLTSKAVAQEQRQMAPEERRRKTGTSSDL